MAAIVRINGVPVAADGAEIQRVPAAALRKREAEISADAVEVDLIRRCGAADARFPGNGLTVNIAAVRRKRSQGDISADSTEFIVLSQKPRAGNIAACGADGERIHAASHQLDIRRDSLDRNVIQRQRIRQEDGQRLSRQIHVAEKPRFARLDDELSVADSVAHPVILIVSGIILLKSHAVCVRFDQIHIAGQPMDLDFCDICQQLGSRCRLLFAAEAGAVQRFIAACALIDIAFPHTQHGEDRPAREVQRQYRYDCTHADERDGPAGELFLLAGLRRLRRSGYRVRCRRRRKIPLFGFFRRLLVLIQLRYVADAADGLVICFLLRFTGGDQIVVPVERMLQNLLLHLRVADGQRSIGKKFIYIDTDLLSHASPSNNAFRMRTLASHSARACR